MAEAEYLTIEAARRNRLSNKTRKGYASGINQIVIWASQAGRNDLLADDIDEPEKSSLNLGLFGYQDFLEWRINKPKKITVGTLDSYRSAIKNLYKQQNIKLPEAYNDDMKEVYSGRKSIRFDHFTFEDDSIGITFHKTKTAQEGTKNKDPKHCFGNPLKPTICLFLSLGIYVILKYNQIAYFQAQIKRLGLEKV
ncbi:hypothetical protein Ae201684P_016488 [Aphanomyces euteiches]|nr:hypothetical protein Ae201684P_016488 [Aphanomyces euteiches]